MSNIFSGIQIYAGKYEFESEYPLEIERDSEYESMAQIKNGNNGKCFIVKKPNGEKIELKCDSKVSLLSGTKVRVKDIVVMKYKKIADNKIVDVLYRYALKEGALIIAPEILQSSKDKRRGNIKEFLLNWLYKIFMISILIFIILCFVYPKLFLITLLLFCGICAFVGAVIILGYLLTILGVFGLIANLITTGKSDGTILGGIIKIILTIIVFALLIYGFCLFYEIFGNGNINDGHYDPSLFH